jgi:hypothetical protein
MFGFLLGAVAGGIAAYLYRDKIRDVMEGRTHDVRARAAHGLEKFQKVAEEAMDTAKDQITKGVKAGQEYIRPGDDRESSGSPHTYR